MRKILTILTLSLLAVSCIDDGYDLSDIDTDDLGIGDENSVFTCPLITLRASVSDVTNDQDDLDRVLAEANVWLPNRLPGGAEAVDVETLTGGNGVQRQEAYLSGPDGLLTELMTEIDSDPSYKKLEEIARLIYASYKERFMPEYFPADVPEEEYISAFKLIYNQSATHDLIWENIENFAREYLTMNLKMSVRAFVLDRIDVGSNVRDMITGGRDAEATLSLFGDIATDLPLSFSAEPAFKAAETNDGSQDDDFTRTLFSFPAFTVSPTASAPTEIVETRITSDALTVIFDQKTHIDLNVQLKKYYPKRALESEQGITINLKVRRKGGLTINF